MSGMQLQIAMRFEVQPNQNQVDDNKSVGDYGKEWFQKEPDFVEDDFVEYDPDKNDKWTMNVIGDKIFLDYIMQKDRDIHDIDKDIRNEDMQLCALSFVDKFVKGNENHPVVVDQKLKVLYFYDGGTSGLPEIE
jgi:hypothetical protein